ncbi:putative membrane protein [Burkholderia cepacia]|uniref:Membrane protein n=2 Tax=Burkholderia cepacia TaxID=292 RepID=A0AA88YZK7_BURCE|nr:putative membrane protein [Burkholderia cepacia]
MSQADFLVKGAITGMIASSATVALVHFVIDVGTRWSADGPVVTIVAVLLMAAALLVPPVVSAWRNRESAIDPFFEPDALKPMLQGRTIGIVLGIVFGISVVAGW